MSRSRIHLTALLALVCWVGCDSNSLDSGPSVQQLQPIPPVTPDDLVPCEFPPTGADLTIVINEVMFDNQTAFPDEDGEFSAWVELYNFGTETLELGGTVFSLTSPFFLPLGDWEFPCNDNTTIGAGEYLVLFLDGDMDDPDDLHVSFAPDPTEDLVLVYGNEFFTVDADDNIPDLSFGRNPDGGSDIVLLLTPTPGAANSDPFFPPDAMFIRGDANEDGVVDMADIDELTVLVFDPSQQGPCPDRLDTNDDGEIGVIDITFLSTALAMTSPLPAPFPDPGFDPTADDIPCVEPGP